MSRAAGPALRLAARAAEVAWVVVCALQAFHWLRYFLLPTELNPKLVVALWGVFVLAAAVAAAFIAPASARRFALWICALCVLPLDLAPLAIAVFALPLTSLPARATRWIAPVLAVLAFPLVLYTCNERIYGPLTEDAVLAVLQTRGHEATDYTRQLLTGAAALAWACYAVSAWLCVRARREAPEARPFGGRLVLPALALLFLLAIPGTFARLQTVRLALASGQMDLAQFGPPPAGARPGATRQDLDVVLLLGEATGREYWSLYGYPAPTTPALQALAADGRLAVFRDVVSSYSHTVPSLRAMLYRDTEAQAPATESKRVSLVELMQAHGVAVNWYSAQEAMGPWAMPITRVAHSASVSQFLNTQAGPGGHVAPQDDPDRLADVALRRALDAPAQGSRLLVHHFMAAHSPSCAHQPLGAPQSLSLGGPALFGDGPDFSADVACYARSMRMLDELIAGDIEAVRTRARPTIVVFVPDHGEAPELGTGHNSQRHSARHVEVPLVVAFNDAARATLGDAWKNLQAHAPQRFDTDWTFEMLVDLFGVDGKGLLLQPTSPVADTYTPGARILFPDSRQWNYDVREPSRAMDVLSDARLNMQAIRADGRFRGTVFAHRVDSQAKALAARDRFDGIEQDITMDLASGELKVFHPPKPDVGLRLDDNLAALAANPRLQLWFDTKNLEPATADRWLAALETLDAKWTLKARTVVEIPVGFPADTYARVAAKGWRVSTYLPDDLAACNARPAADAACRARADAWLALAHAGHARFMSFDFGSWPAVQTFLAPRLDGLGLLSWDLRLRADRPDIVERVERMPPLDGLIIPFPTAFDR